MKNAKLGQMGMWSRDLLLEFWDSLGNGWS